MIYWLLLRQQVGVRIPSNTEKQKANQERFKQSTWDQGRLKREKYKDDKIQTFFDTRRGF